MTPGGWLHWWRKRRQLERDLDDEIRFHLEMRARRNRESGMTGDEAAAAARRRFGNSTQWKETLRDMWTLNRLETRWQDIRVAARSLVRARGFTAAALLVLALGIGANTAVFSLVNAALLRGLPFREADSLVMLWGNVQRQTVERRGGSWPDFVDWRAQSTSFTDMAAGIDGNFMLLGGDEPERVAGEYVTPSYFSLTGVTPLLGRVFTAADDGSPGDARVVLLGEGLWRRRFGADPRIVGRGLRVNGFAVTVAGVLPAWYRGLSDAAELWAPFAVSGFPQGPRGMRGLVAVARLKPGVTGERAQAEMDAIARRLERAYPESNERRGVEVADLRNELLGSVRTPLLVLWGAVGLVLLIACANVANLTLARAESQRREMAVRAALGGGRARLLYHALTESLLLSAGGAALGLALAVWLTRAMVAASPVPLPSFVQPSVDARVALFTAAVALLSALLAGAAPAWRAAGRNLAEAMKDSGERAGEGRGQLRMRGALVAAEVALAMTLLTGAGLLMRSFVRLTSIDPGYRPDGLLTLQIGLPRLERPDVPVTVGARQVLERVRALPGVKAAAMGTDLPLDGSGQGIFYEVEGHDIRDARTRPRAYIHRASPEWFAALGATFAAGGTYGERETDRVVVSEGLARRFWAGQDPVGKRLRAGPNAPWLVVSGVVRDMKYRGLPANPTADPDVFAPLTERQRGLSLVVRTEGAPGALAGPVRAALKELEPSAPVYNVSTMRERVEAALRVQRFAGAAMSVFAGLALLLAAVGVYGLTTYTVRRRTREIGLRMAIGAGHRDVARMVLRGGMAPVLAGLAAGLAAALALTRYLETLLFGVPAADPATFGGVAIALCAVAVAACYLPARRAARIDPLTAIRYE